MGMLVLLPHVNRYEIDGARYDFEGPLFLTKLAGAERGLFMTVRDDRHPDERVFLHMPLAYAMQIMAGWTRDPREAEGLLTVFATQNHRMLQHFVLNVTVEHLVSEHGNVTRHLDGEVRVLRLRKPENIKPLEDYAN